VAKSSQWTPRLHGENHAYEERHRTELTEATEEGRSLVAKSSQWTPRLHGENHAYEERASHRGHGGHRGTEEDWIRWLEHAQ
jgi:hypothetical protein